ncbi:NAD(P)/FAD-dependent oxidoreductase [Paenibacillus oenotherae]|uniref:NAD(P)/FAD-dependent oxidoreductase n=1 Tax=Paenibacillus oenotherae TaxID=1435645 RepID=A0ABS7DAW5_9BACL|nr:NAD(P)/FAD-dependent oxidoreductase [Paenibacillus oenotherae]MBW7477082.1 NAD(P)/FAD-dependent oxidoreductase [Paenibacillus oenotherae]
MVYDCVIIGGGPAGLNAALVLGRARRSTLLIDSSKPRNAVTHASHGFITRDGVKPAEFRAIAHEELSQYPTVRRLEGEVAGLSSTESGFQVETAEGEKFAAGKLILATGLKETFPAIEGFHDFYGKSLFNCPYCDGWELKDKPLVLVTESNRALHMVKTVYNWSRDLVLCTNGHSIITDEQQRVLSGKGIRVITEPIAAFLGEEGRLAEVRFAGGSSIAREGGFVTPQFSQTTSFGEQLGCERNEMGGIVTDSFGRTSVKGVYAAGDTAVITPSQLIIAAAEGSRSAIGVNTDLTEEAWEDLAL